MKSSFVRVASKSLAALAGILIVSASSSAFAYVDCGPAPSCTILGVRFCGCPWGEVVETPVDNTTARDESSGEACFDEGSSTDIGAALASFQPAAESAFNDDATCS